jgi:hypothetical protein
MQGTVSLFDPICCHCQRRLSVGHESIPIHIGIGRKFTTIYDRSGDPLDQVSHGFLAPHIAALRRPSARIFMAFAVDSAWLLS